MGTIQPEDIVALCAILGCLALLAFGNDGPIRQAFISLVSYYFGRLTTRRKK